MTDSRLSARALESLLGDWRGRGPTYVALADAIRVLCLDRRIASGTALPAERELASRLHLSRTTVASAYRDLRDTRHIESVRGSGSITLPVAPAEGVAMRGATGASIDLFQASPDAWPGLADLYREAVQSVGTWVTRPGYDIVGNVRLREAIAARYRAAGIETDVDQIVITNGAQSAISQVASAIVSRGDRAVIETPTYPHAAEAIRRVGARLIAVPVDPRDGWDMDRMDHVLRRAAPSLAYLMPDFQNPTGASMAIEDRAAIIEIAASSGVTLLVDETTAELDISRTEVLPRMGAGVPADRARHIVHVGSMGKTVWGGLRVGWIRADHDLVQRIVAARPAVELGTPELEQQVALLAIERMPEIIDHRSRTLRSNRDALSAALAQHVPEWDVAPVDGGVAMWLGLGAPLSSPLALAARARGLTLSSGGRFGVDGGHERRLRVPFTSAPEVLVRAVEILAESWTEVQARRPASVEPLIAVV